MRAGTKMLLDRLSDEQKAALKRASLGYPPVLLSWSDAPDTGAALDAPLQIIESTARAILRGYEWPLAPSPSDWPLSGFVDFHGQRQWRAVGPDWQPDARSSRLQYEVGADRVYPRYDEAGRRVEGVPDLRPDALALIQAIAELRFAAAARHLESALLRALTIGTLHARLAAVLFHGAGMASEAANLGAKPEGHETLRENWTEKLIDRDKYIQECDAQIRFLTSKRSRAARIKSGWLTNGVREKGLDKWVAAFNEGLPPDQHVQTLTVDKISRMLGART